MKSFKEPSSVELDNAVLEATSVREAARQAGVHVVPFTHRAFPDRLRRIPDPPVILYVRGDIASLHGEMGVAIVGTREPSNSGGEWAHDVGRIVAELGHVVVSGLAKGCDTSAHEGCVDAGGVGVGVLAHGLHYVYPKENTSLAERLVDLGGCLVSEYPVGARARRGAFVERNRLQTGLSDLLLVAETAVKGGTMHTVGFAREQGRPVGCYYSHSESWQRQDSSLGNLQLINDGTAEAVKDIPSLHRLLDRVWQEHGNQTVPSSEDSFGAGADTLCEEDSEGLDTHLGENKEDLFAANDGSNVQFSLFE